MDIKEKMKALECHYNWDIEVIVGDIDIVKKSKIKSEEFSGKTWSGLLVALNLVYELHKRNECSEAEEKLRDCLELYKNIKDNFLDEYKQSFQHVLFSVQLFLSFNKSSENEIRKLFDKIPPYSTLTRNEKAAITGIKAYCFGEYKPEGRKHSLALARKAHEENPNEPEWSFEIALTLSRIRNYTYDSYVTDEEINCMEKAYNQSKSPYFQTYLAQTYLDCTKMVLYSSNDKIKKLSREEKVELLKEFNRKSYELFREVLARTGEKDVHIKIRCVRGLHQLYRYKPINPHELLNIVTNCLNVAPNYGMGHTLASSIYSVLEQFDKALKHSIEAEKSGDYFSSIRIIQLKYLLNLKVNAAETFDYMLKKHPTETYLYQTHLHAIAYYIFKERNLSLAVKHFLLVSKLNTMERKDYELWNVWGKKRFRVDLCQKMFNEVKSAIDRGCYQTDEERVNLEEAYKVFQSKYPDVMKPIDSRMDGNMRNMSLKGDGKN